MTGWLLAATLYPYAYLGVGYKISEQEFVIHWASRDQSELQYERISDSFVAEVGFEHTSGFKFGLKHDSQLSEGFPVNSNEREYWKTEAFLGYKFGGIK